jgi:hypothetical protein
MALNFVSTQHRRLIDHNCIGSDRVGSIACEPTGWLILQQPMDRCRLPEEKRSFF